MFRRKLYLSAPDIAKFPMRIGVDSYYDYFKKFGLLTKTGIDLPGEAGTIMHKKENIFCFSSWVAGSGVPSGRV